jgi:protein-disulfide isomerase
VQNVPSMSPVNDSESDLTRKERREQARASRKAIEEAEAGQAAQRKRLIQLGAVAGGVVAIIAIILVATGSGSKNPPAPKSAAASSALATVTTMLQGIPQKGNVLGNPNAPVTMQYFGDLECPFCKQFTVTTLPTIIQKYVRTGKLKLEYNSMETATKDPETFRTQQIAAYAAGKQNLAWYFIELFYHEQGEEDSGYVTESYLQGLAAQVPGLNLSAWSEARNDPAYANQIVSDAQAVTQNGFTGTPSFLLGKSGGTLHKFESASLTEAGPFEAAIEKQLKA